MMKKRFIPTFGLFIILLASCAPAAVPGESSAQQPSAPIEVASSPTAFLPSEPTLAPTLKVIVAPTEAVVPLPVATSRGPDLEATDPSSVNLASGNLQFVEFFRFT